MQDYNHSIKIWMKKERKRKEDMLYDALLLKKFIHFLICGHFACLFL